jgi:hypothetical protein
MKWVTRERPVIDRIACPWLISRFIDKEPEFLFVPPDQVARVAEETGATPYDVPGVEFTHVGDGCSFDAFVSKYQLDSFPAIVTIAAIVRGTNTDRLDLTPQSAGLLAISLELRDVTSDDHEVLRHGFVIYDAPLRLGRKPDGREAQLAADNEAGGVIMRRTSRTGSTRSLSRRAISTDLGIWGRVQE